jgi:protein TonB
MKEIEFTPSITSATKTMAAAPALHPAVASTTQMTTRETDAPAPEPPPEQPAESAGNPEKGNGLMSTPLGLWMTHGYFSGLSYGRSLRDNIRGYYFETVEKINREWWDKAGLLKEPLNRDGIFELLVQRDGTIVSIQMLQGTGSREADLLLTEIIGKASPLPALPSTYNQELFQAPLRIKAPSILFRSSHK